MAKTQNVREIINKEKPKEVRINTKRLFIFNLKHFIRYIFSGEVLLTIIALAFLLLFMPVVPLISPLIFLMVATMAYKFAFDVLIDTASGQMSPKVRMNYIVTNAIILKVLLVSLIYEGILYWMNMRYVTDVYKLLFIVYATFVTPAIYMSLALSNSLFVALNPMTLFKAIKTSPFSYALFVGFWLSSKLLYEWLILPTALQYLPKFVDIFVYGFFKISLLILNFHIMGYLVFQNRKAYDLKAMGMSVKDSDEVVIDEIKENPIYKRIKKLLKEDEAETALAMIIELQKDGDNSIELKELSQKAMKQKLYTPTNVEFGHKIHRRLSSNQPRKAFQYVSEHLKAGKEYIEAYPDDIYLLVKYAVGISNTKIVAQLVKDFHIKYPYHKDIVPNYFALAKILYKNPDTKQQAGEILQGLIKKYPQDEYMNEIKSWYKGIELMQRKGNRH